MASLFLFVSAVRSPPSPSQAIAGFRRPNGNVAKLTGPALSPTSLGFRFCSLIFLRKSNLHERKNMICLPAQLHPRTHLPTLSTSRPLSKPLKKTDLHLPYEFMKSYAPIRRRPTRFLTLANNGNKNGKGNGNDENNNNNNNNNKNNGLRKDPNEREENGEKSGGLGSEGSDGSGKENGWSLFNSIRWGELLLNPDPGNILAVGLTGLFTWASVQVLWQLLFISLAILVAAVKYSLIAAILIFILITLL